MKEVAFERIVSRNGSQDEAFEELCAQLAQREPNVPQGSVFRRLRGAGGDGGVECFWILPSGEEWGWQAKYIFDFDRAVRDLEQSFRTAVAEHPRVVRYVACLPFDLTGRTARGRGQQDKFDEQRVKWEDWAATIGVKVSIEVASASTLRGQVIGRDPTGGIAEYFFNDHILGDEWFQRHLRESLRTAGPRYTAQLGVDTPLPRAFAALGRSDEFLDDVRSKAVRLRKVLKSLAESVGQVDDGGWSAAFPKNLRDSGSEVVARLEVATAHFDGFFEPEPAEPVQSLSKTLLRVLPLLRGLREALREDLERQHGEGTADSAHFRQFNAEYQQSFPAANVDATQECTDAADHVAEWASSSATSLFDSGIMLLLGAWGTGKTHGICDAAVMRDRDRLRTILLFGEQFDSGTEPWDQIRRLLGFNAEMTPDRILGALNAAGEASGRPLLICIDGLNETRPRRGFWRDQLSRMAEQISRYTFLRLCVSCRTTYEQIVLPDGHKFTTVLHEGFKGLEHRACQAFFRYYDLEPPVRPILQEEFSNPLFLRLVCEALKGLGERRLPDGWYGINTTISAFLASKNRAYARDYEGDERAGS